MAAGAVGVRALAVGEEVGDDVAAVGTSFDGNAGWMKWAATALAVGGAFAGGKAGRKEGEAAGTVFAHLRNGMLECWSDGIMVWWIDGGVK